MTYSVFVDGVNSGSGMDYSTAYTHARTMATDSPYLPRPIKTDDYETYPHMVKGFDSVDMYCGRLNPCAGRVEIRPDA